MIRVNTGFLGITVAALALTLACGDDSSSGELNDGGLEAGADESDDTTPTSTDDDPTTPTDPTNRRTCERARRYPLACASSASSRCWPSAS